MFAAAKPSELRMEQLREITDTTILTIQVVFVSLCRSRKLEKREFWLASVVLRRLRSNFFLHERRLSDFIYFKSNAWQARGPNG